MICAKSTFLLVSTANKNDPITTDGTARGFQYDEGKILFCFLFSDPIIVGLKLGRRNPASVSSKGCLFSLCGVMQKLGFARNQA